MILKDSTLKIITASINKLDLVADFMETAYANTYPNDRGITRDMFEGNTELRTHLRKYLTAQLTDTSKVLLLAVHTKKIIGTLGLQVTEDLSVGEIWGFYVASNFQSKGVGRHLWGKIMEHKLLLGLNKLTLYVATDSKKAKDFYEKRGFEVIAEEDWDWPHWTKERPHNQYWKMEKDLR